MKKTSFLFLVLSQIIIHCSAQQPGSDQPSKPASEAVSKFSAEVLAGPSIPLGKFSDKSVNSIGASEASGGARVGPALQVAFNYHIKPSYGITLSGGYQGYGQDVSQLAGALQQQYPNGTVHASGNSWKAWKILAGGFVQVPLADGSKWYFQGKLLGGVLKTSVPGYSYTVTSMVLGNQSPIATGTTKGPSLPWAFCYQADAGLGWKLSDRISLLLDVSYFHAEPIWKYTLFVTVPPPSGGGTPTQTKIPVSGLNIMAGLGFRF